MERELTLVLNTASEVLMTDCSADDVKKTYQDSVGVFEAFHIPCGNFKNNSEDANDLGECEAYFTKRK